jgi:hypothetical protein
LKIKLNFLVEQLEDQNELLGPSKSFFFGLVRYDSYAGLFILVPFLCVSLKQHHQLFQDKRWFPSADAKRWKKQGTKQRSGAVSLLRIELHNQPEQ